MWHPQDDILDPHLAGFVDDGLEGRNHDLTALQAKPLLRGPLPGQEIFKPAWGEMGKGGQAGLLGAVHEGLEQDARTQEAAKPPPSAQSRTWHRHHGAPTSKQHRSVGRLRVLPTSTDLWLHPFPVTTLSSPSSHTAPTSHSPAPRPLLSSTHVPWGSLIMPQRCLTAQLKFQPTRHCSGSHFTPSSWARGSSRPPQPWTNPASEKFRGRARQCPACRKALLHSLHTGTSFCHFHPHSVSCSPGAPSSPAFPYQAPS